MYLQKSRENNYTMPYFLLIPENSNCILYMTYNLQAFSFEDKISIIFCLGRLFLATVLATLHMYGWIEV